MIGRRGWGVALVLGVVVTGVALWQAGELRVATRLEELLPDDAPAAADYRRFLETFGGFEKVYALVLWEGDGEPDAALLADAADRLGRGLTALPEVAAVRSGLTPEDEDFLRQRVLPRAPLFLGEAGDGGPAPAERLDPAFVRRRVAEIRRLVTSPGGAAQARWQAADPLGFAGGLGGLTRGAGSLVRVDPLTGAFLSRDGDAALVLVTPSVGELDAAAGRALAAGLDAAWREVAAAFPDAPLGLAAVGGPLYAAQDERVIREDLTRTLTGSALAVALLLVLYFGSAGVPLAVVAGVAAGIVWTAGLTGAVHGEVSVLGLSFAALLLGLGVDYGIHGASRFRAARLAGSGPAAAVGWAIGMVGPAILVSAATTAAAFLVLALAHFRPVREMGQVMAFGVTAILLASVAVGAPLLVLAGRWGRPPAEGGWRRSGWRGAGRLVEAAVGLARGGPGWTLATAAAVSLLALLGLGRLDLSVDLRALRPADHPAFAAEERLIESFAVGLDSSTVVVEAASLDAALTASRRVEEAVAALLPAGSQVASPAHWLPGGEIVARRVEELGGAPAAAAAAALRRAVAEEGLSPRPFSAALDVLDALAAGRAPAEIPPGAWPDWVGELVRRRGDGSAAVAVRLTTPLGSWPEGPPAELLTAVQRAAPGAAVASVPRLGTELRRVVLRDFRRLGGWALAAVAAVVLLAFRGRPLPALLALLPVTLGCLWTLGLAGWAGLALDPFTVVVAPLLVGIGIDDGLHAVVGARAYGGDGGDVLGGDVLGGGLAASIRENGRAMLLTTLTTGAGFGSLLASRVPSLATAGALVAAGTLLCLAATLLVLPAAAALAAGKGRA